MTGVVGVGEVLGEGKEAAAAFVNHLDGQTAPARLTVLDDVEQERTVGKFAAVGVVAAVIDTDFDALLTERATVVVREENLDFFGGWMPCDEVIAGRRDDKVAQGRFRVAYVAVHADLGAQVAHDSRYGVGHDDGAAVGQFEHVFGDRPVAGLAAAVDGANTHVVVAGAHGHAGRDDVFSSFLSGVSVEDVAAGDDASVPQVGASSRNFNLEIHAVDGVDIVVGIALGKDGDIVPALNDIRADHLRGLNKRDTVVVHTNFGHVVASGHVAGDAHEASTEVGGPNVAWQVGGVKRGRTREERGARCHVQGRDGNGVNRRGGGAVLVVEFERATVGVVQVAGVLHIGLQRDRVATDVRGGALVVGDRHA